jgi:hypothetical protein
MNEDKKELHRLYTKILIESYQNKFIKICEENKLNPEEAFDIFRNSQFFLIYTILMSLFDYKIENKLFKKLVDLFLKDAKNCIYKIVDE